MSNIKSTTQNHLDVIDIKSDIVVLKNGGAATILETNAINFDLLSIQEQDAAIGSFSSLLNSLSFPIQITIRSKQMDISEYLERIKEFEQNQQNKKVKEQLRMYRSFINDELVTKDNVLDKNFYVTVPYKTFELNTTNAFGWVDDLFGMSTKAKSKVNVDRVLHEATADLEPKTNFLIKEFARIGIKATQLRTTDLIKLFYSIYNSETAQSQKIRGDVSEYTSTLVEPKLV